MLFHLLNNREITKQKLELLPNMDKFFLAHALTLNGELVKFATNYEQWFSEYQNNWKDDPIVSVEYPIKAKFSVSEWLLPVKSSKQKQFYELCQHITGVNYGLTAFKASASLDGKITEFYSIAATDEFPISGSLIFDPVFVRFALQHVFKMFKQ